MNEGKFFKPESGNEKNRNEANKASEAQHKWDKVKSEIETAADSLGYKIDAGIKDPVVALNAFEINTGQSCEGHLDSGMSAPWIRIESPNEPEERFINQNEIFEKVAKKYNMPVEEAKRMFNVDAYWEAMHECANNGETKDYQKWKEESGKLLYTTKKILDDFYKNRQVSNNIKIKVDTESMEDMAGGSFEIFNGGKDYRDIGDEKLSPDEKEALDKRLKEYRKEMTVLSEFMKGKFFVEGESYVNNIRKKIQEDSDQKNIEKIRKMMVGQGLPENIKSTNKQEQNNNGIKEKVLILAEKMKIPVISEDNMDEILGDRFYLSHAIVVKPERLLDVLNSGELQSSEKSGKAAMTYESDKLMGMDKNVFLALGKGYMRKDRYALIFDPEKISQLPETSFIEGDLMDLGHDAMIDFVDKHKPEILEAINNQRELIKKKFQEKVEYAFEGGHGIYEKYFSNSPADIVDDFLKAIGSKGFEGIESEKEVIDQFTIPSDIILSAEVMPPELRKELINILQEDVINKQTIAGSENIQQAIKKSWQNDKENYSTFLTGERMTPEKVTEVRIPNQMKLQEAIIAIFVPK